MSLGSDPISSCYCSMVGFQCHCYYHEQMDLSGLFPFFFIGSFLFHLYIIISWCVLNISSL